MGKDERSNKGKPPRGKDQQTDLHIPQHKIEALARMLLPEIQKFFESEEGQREFEEWKMKQNDKQEEIE